MLKVILACYTEFEEKVDMMNANGVKRTAYGIVKVYVSEKIGKFTSADVIVARPGAGRSVLLATFKKTDRGKHHCKIGKRKKCLLYPQRCGRISFLQDTTPACEA